MQCVSYNSRNRGTSSSSNPPLFLIWFIFICNLLQINSSFKLSLLFCITGNKTLHIARVKDGVNFWMIFLQNESSSDEHGTSAAALGMDLENTPANREIHTEDTVCDAVCEEQQLLREATMRSLVEIQRRAEQRWQRDRDRQKLRVQERLSIIQNRKSDEDLLGLRREETFRHLTNTLQLEDEQQQKVLVREKLQQLWRERSYILQSRRERNKSEFEELLTPTAQFVTNTEDGLTTHTHTDMNLPLTHQNHPPPHTHM
ncbi:uncharacterized protein LOC124395798 isoform X2 [Silurus meridionalis]|nr:uncharacterized protein LOC124395798 isoform X2 [Silurus meridionalis]